MKHTKKFLALALAIVSLFAIAAPALAATTKWVIATPNVNFRVSPGGALIDRIPYGVSVSEQSTSIVNGVQWSYVLYNGTYGYIQTQYLSATNPGGSGGHPSSRDQAFGTMLLQKGQTSYYVKNLQLALIQEDYLAPGSADGIFGNNTLAAVLAFQEDYCSLVDGLVGTETKQYLWDFQSVYLKTYGVMSL